MPENKKYVTLSLEELEESELVAVEIVMREGAFRFQEQVAKELYRLKRTVESKKVAKGIQKSIDLIYEYEVKID